MPPIWLPQKCCIGEHDGKWPLYREAIFEIFKRDFITSQPKFNDCWVRHDWKAHTDGKPFGFWHCITEGEIEVERLPDFNRCERIGWIRSIIENHHDTAVDVWENERDKKVSTLLWLEELYLVVLRHGQSKKGEKVYHLKTAYCTTEKGRLASLRDERDKYYERIEAAD